jgi:hypothetical protein
MVYFPSAKRSKLLSAYFPKNLRRVMGHCLQEEIQPGYRGVFGIRRPYLPGMQSVLLDQRSRQRIAPIRR